MEHTGDAWRAGVTGESFWFIAIHQGRSIIVLRGLLLWLRAQHVNCCRWTMPLLSLPPVHQLWSSVCFLKSRPTLIPENVKRYQMHIKDKISWNLSLQNVFAKLLATSWLNELIQWLNKCMATIEIVPKYLNYFQNDFLKRILKNSVRCFSEWKPGR